MRLNSGCQNSSWSVLSGGEDGGEEVGGSGPTWWGQICGWKDVKDSCKQLVREVAGMCEVARGGWSS